MDHLHQSRHYILLLPGFKVNHSKRPNLFRPTPERMPWGHCGGWWNRWGVKIPENTQPGNSTWKLQQSRALSDPLAPFIFKEVAPICRFFPHKKLSDISSQIRQGKVPNCSIRQASYPCEQSLSPSYLPEVNTRGRCEINGAHCFQKATH